MARFFTIMYFTFIVIIARMNAKVIGSLLHYNVLNFT